MELNGIGAGREIFVLGEDPHRQLQGISSAWYFLEKKSNGAAFLNALSLWWRLLLVLVLKMLEIVSSKLNSNEVVR